MAGQLGVEVVWGYHVEVLDRVDVGRCRQGSAADLGLDHGRLQTECLEDQQDSLGASLDLNCLQEWVGEREGCQDQLCTVVTFLGTVDYVWSIAGCHLP